jgi:CDP-4-dehydro-6-deoxyglucose reductase, E3
MSATDDYGVRIEPHGRLIRVKREQPILDAALAAGLNLPHSCKSGHCASCRARLRTGEIRYPNGRPLGITAAEEDAGNILLCQARPASDLVVEARLIAAVADVEIKTLPCRIARLTPLAADVMQVWLRLPAVETISFQPGQYLDILLDGGRRRSFSIASPPHDSELLELHVRRVAGGGFTEKLFGTLGVGALLRIEGPVGQFTYREGLGPVIMVAGGTGFAPLKSMLRHVLEQPSANKREIHLYWGAQEAEGLYEDETLKGWAKAHPNLRYAPTIKGWVHEAVMRDYPNLSAYEVYAAGPPAMIEAIRTSFPQHGLPEDRLYFDSFDYAPDVLARLEPKR